MFFFPVILLILNDQVVRKCVRSVEGIGHFKKKNKGKALYHCSKQGREQEAGS